MILRATAIRLLSLSYFNAFRGMPWLLAIGAVTLLLGVLGSAATRTAFLVAGLMFTAVLPAFFAGVHFRKLASRRSFSLLPDFSIHMLVAVLVVLLLVSALAGVVVAITLETGSRSVVPVSLLFFSAVFWIGFLPWLLRFLIACGVVLVASRLAVQDIELTPGVATISTGIVIAGWAWFSAWFASFVAARRYFGPAAIGLDVSALLPRRVGTAAGTLLRGSPDALGGIVIAALLRVLAIPCLLYLGFWLLAGVSPERLFRGPVIAYLALTYAFVNFLQLANRVGSRRMLLWLRTETDMQGLARRCEATLWKELGAMAVGLVCLVVLIGNVNAVNGVDWAWFFAAWFSALVFELYLVLNRGATDPPGLWIPAGHLLVLAVATAMLHTGFDSSVMAFLCIGQLLAAAILRFQMLQFR